MPLEDFLSEPPGDVRCESEFAIVAANFGEVLHVGGVPLDTERVESVRWRTLDNGSLSTTVQHFRDARGSLFVANWVDDAAEPCMALIRASADLAPGVVAPTKCVYADGRLLNEPARALLEEELRPAKLRVETTYEETPYEMALLNLEETAWTGGWVIPREGKRGAVRGRLLASGSDRFFIGEWVEHGHVNGCFALLRPG